MVTIGNVRISSDRRQILVSNKPFRLGSRAFDLLELLIDARGQIVSKNEIMRRVWPDTVVVENNLHVHVSAIRKMLGEWAHLLVAVPGRGYRLTMEARVPIESGQPWLALPASRTNLPRRSPAVYGRDPALEEVVEACHRSSLVTLVGPGGIGKTRLAIESARRLSASLDGGAWMVELSGVTKGAPVAGAIADVLAADRASEEEPMEAAIAALSGRRGLLVLDNCEHVVDAAAEAAQAILSAVPACRIVATSREPLKVRGEIVYKVAPLEVPYPDDDFDAVLAKSAVQLFLARARAVDGRFACDAESVRLVGEICRRLDGLPLAIELAASRVASLGITELAARLDDGWEILSGGYRTALPQHRTLRATFDWSYDLLSAKEQTVMRRLSIFPSFFGLEAATFVASEGEAAVAEVLDALCGLVEKSLLVTEFQCGGVRYKLLEASRAYARQRLAKSGELESVTQRYVSYAHSEEPTFI